MFYRRKILLSLLQAFDGQLEKLALNKLMLITSLKQKKPSYDFVPYKFGCYSFSMKADIDRLLEIGILSKEGERYKKKIEKSYFNELDSFDRIIIKEVRDRFTNFESKDLIKYTYNEYPYYAINSLIAEDILEVSSYSKIVENIPKKEDYVLFTIGYEGISLESYFNKLISNDINILVDVRRNAKSMKFGFSKKTLSAISEKLKIKYLHIPELGINSMFRKELNSQEDYESLFESYKKENLSKTVDEQKYILSLLSDHKRVALTCFEADKCQCHRSHLAESITKLEGFKYEVIHL